MTGPCALQLTFAGENGTYLTPCGEPYYPTCQFPCPPRRYYIALGDIDRHYSPWDETEQEPDHVERHLGPSPQASFSPLKGDDPEPTLPLYRMRSRHELWKRSRNDREREHHGLGWRPVEGEAPLRILPFVELGIHPRQDLPITALSFGKPQCADSINQNLFGVRIRFKQRHRFRDVVCKTHGIGVGGLVGPR